MTSVLFGLAMSSAWALAALPASETTPVCTEKVCASRANVMLQASHLASKKRRSRGRGNNSRRRRRSCNVHSDFFSEYPSPMMQDSSICDSVHLDENKLKRWYRHGLTLDGVFFPYFGSAVLDGNNVLKYKKAAIFVHGLGGHANTVFCNAVKAAEEDFGCARNRKRCRRAASDPGTLVIAPWFGGDIVPAESWTDRLPPGINSTCWSGPKGGNWYEGGDSYGPDGKRKSAFEMLDAIVHRLQNRTRFPELQNIAVAGHSAGCQLLSRWAVFSAAPMQSGPEVSIIVGNCGSYLYFDNTRPAIGCRPMRDTGGNHTCKTYEVPAATTLVDCPEWNEYKYGLEMDSDDNPYVHDVLRTAAKLHESLERFAKINFEIVLGSRDNCNCRQRHMKNRPHCFSTGASCEASVFDGCCDTSPDSAGVNYLDDECGANLEGSNRLQRGLNYAAYLQQFFSKRSIAYAPRVHLFEGAHDVEAWSRSEAFSSMWSLEIDMPF